MSEVKSIIFDLGGVFLNIDYHKSINEFSKVSGKDVSKLFTQHSQGSLFDDYEKGRISCADFRRELNSILETNLSNEEFDIIWNKMLLDFPIERLRWLEEVSKRKRIFLFSNTNTIHKKEFDNIFKAISPNKVFCNYFEKAYYSHILEKRKPEAEAFEQILTENGLDKKNTLFIDDSIQHIESAKSIGIMTYLLPQNKLLEDDFILSL